MFICQDRVQFQFACYLLVIYSPWQETQIRRRDPRPFFSVWQSFSFLYAWIFKRGDGRKERDKISNFPPVGHTPIKGTTYTQTQRPDQSQTRKCWILPSQFSLVKYKLHMPLRKSSWILGKKIAHAHILNVASNMKNVISFGWK